MTTSGSPRFLTLLLAAVLAAGALAGCAENGDGNNAPTGTGTTTPTGTGGTTPTGTGTTPTGTGTTPTLEQSGPNDVYGMTTGSSTGVYFAIGNGIANAVNNASSPGFTFSEVATSQGSVQNVQRLRQDDHQFALMQNDVAYYAVNGENAFQGNAYADLRAVAALYPELIQIVTLRESNIRSLQDLAGRSVVLGAPGSGAAVNAGQILNASGVQANTQYLDLSTAADRLKDGGVDAVFWTGGIPTGAIVSLATTHPVHIVPVDDQTVQALQEEAPFYATVTLPAGTYEGVEEDVQTVAVVAILATQASVPGDDVYRLLQILFEGTDVQNAHAQGRNIQLESAGNGLAGIPLHDAARAYFEQQGIELPASSAGASG